MAADNLLGCIARRIKSPQNSRRIISSSRDLDALLLSPLTSQLPEQKIKEMESKGIPLEERIIADYFYSNNIDVTSAVGRSDSYGTFANAYSTVSRSQGEEASPSSPLKQLSAAAYISSLKSPLSLRLLSSSGPKISLQEVVLFDYLFRQLSQERKQKIEQLGQPDLLQHAALLAIIQATVPVVSSGNEEIEKEIEKLKKEKQVDLPHLRTYKNFRKSPVPEVRYEEDREASEVFARRNSLLGEYHELVQTKTYERVKQTEEVLKAMESEVDQIEGMSLLDGARVKRIENINGETRRIETFYAEAELSGEAAVSRTMALRRRGEGMLSAHNEYITQGPLALAKAERLRTLRKKTKKLAARPLTDKCRKILDEALMLRSEANSYASNRYMHESAREIISAYDSFASAAMSSVSQQKTKLETKARKTEDKISSDNSSALVKLSRPLLRRRLNKTRRIIQALENLERDIRFSA